MGKKEELSEQYRRKAYEVSPTRKRCQHNNEVIAWNNEIVGAFESGWDAAAKEMINQLRQTLSLMSNVHPSIQKHIIDVVESNIMEE